MVKTDQLETSPRETDTRSHDRQKRNGSLSATLAVITLLLPPHTPTDSSKSTRRQAGPLDHPAPRVIAFPAPGSR